MPLGPKQQADWEELPTLSNDYTLKEQAISEYAKKIFFELLVSNSPNKVIFYLNVRKLSRKKPKRLVFLVVFSAKS